MDDAPSMVEALSAPVVASIEEEPSDGVAPSVGPGGCEHAAASGRESSARWVLNRCMSVKGLSEVGRGDESVIETSFGPAIQAAFTHR
jgi:hypothetical protein